MKKQVFKRIIVGLLLVFAFAQVMFLSSCGIEEVNIISMELVEGAPTDFVIGDFDYSKYSFVVTYKDGETKTIPLTEEMLSGEDYLKTYKDGTHQLTARYLNQTCTFTVTAKRFNFPTNLKLEDAEFVYDGEFHALDVIGQLPEGTTITYPSSNQYTDVGIYTINAILVNPLYVTTSISGKLTITQADYDMTGIEFNGGTFTYDGTPKSISVTGAENRKLEITYTMFDGKVESNAMTEANETAYIVTAHFDAGGNYKEIKPMTAELKINKAVYDMSNVVFANKEVVYDGNIKSIKVGNLTTLPKGVTVQYVNNDQKLVGSYNIIAKFTGDSTNYEAIPDKVATLTITPGKINLSNVYMENQSFVYDRTPHFISYTGDLPTGVTFSKYEYYLLDNNDKEIEKVDAIINVGRYHVKANFLYSDKINYDPIDPIVSIVEITKADLTEAVFNDTTFEYDGFSHSIYVSNLPEGVSVTYKNNAQKEVGNYTVTATFTYAAGSLAEKNYNQLNPMNATLSISKATMGSNFEDISLEYAGKNYTYKISDYEGINGSYLGKQIVLTCGGEEISNQKIYEYLPKGVSIFYTKVDNVTKVETEFDGSTNPGTTFIYVNYYAETLDIANSCYSHYYIDDPTLITATIEGVQKQVYLLARKYLMINITKKTYTPTFINQLNQYTGTDIEVLIDTTTDLAADGKYPNLSFATGYDKGGIYTNNIQSQPGIYSGSVKVQLSDEALKYYEVDDNYEFLYAILNPTGQITFDPNIADIISEDYDTNKSVYTLDENVAMPQGMTIKYIYTNDIVKPGSYAVKIAISFEDDGTSAIGYGDVAKFYYRLPANYIQAADGSYSKIITYTINHILYTPSFITEYEYDGSPIIPKAIDLPDWVSVVYYDGENQVKYSKTLDTDYVLLIPNTYHLTAKLSIVNADMAQYYTVDQAGSAFDLTIKKGHFSDYQITGETWKYDGEIHNIVVTGLPEGVTYTTSLGEGRRDVGVYKDVIIYFENKSLYYEDLDNVKLTMTIEKNTVQLGNLEAYVKTSGNKNIKQFATLKDTLKEYVDLTGANVDWEIDYYENSIIYPSEYTNRHGDSEKLNDFTFTESTADNEFVLCSFTIKLKDGYVFDDAKQSTSYTGNITFAVSQTKKVALGDLAEISDDKEIHVSQGSSLETLIYSKAPETLKGSFEIEAWTADYYHVFTPYPAEYKVAHGSSAANSGDSKFTFELNTWGERYCKVTYTLRVIGDYCFYINGQSYQTYSSSFNCLVDQNVIKVDDYFINQAITTDAFKADKYSYLDKYLEKLIDTNYVALTYSVYNSLGAKTDADNNGRYMLLDTTAANTIDLSVTLQGSAKGFVNSKDTSISIKNRKVELDNPQVVDVYNAYAIARQKSDSHTFVLEQYVQPGSKQITAPIMQNVLNNTYYGFVVTYPSGNIYKGINETSISLTEVTNGDDEAICQWTFQEKDGYCILDPVTGERLEKYRFYLNFKVQAVTMVDTSEFTEYSNETHQIDQYTDLEDEVGKYVKDIKDVFGDALNIQWSAAYYDGTEKMNVGFNTTDNTGDVKGILDLATSGDQYFYITINLSSAQNSGYIFDTISKEYQIALRYEVNAVTLFKEDKLATLGAEKEYVSKNSTLQQIINKYALNSNLSLSSWSVNYTTDMELNNNGTGAMIFLFNQITLYHVTAEFETAPGTCLELNGKYYDKYTIQLEVQPLEQIPTKGLIDLQNKVTTVEQYSSISDAVADYIKIVKDYAGDKLQIKWSAAYYDGLNKIDNGYSVVDSLDPITGLFDFSTTSSQYFSLELQFILGKDTGYIFDTSEATYTSKLRFKVTNLNSFEDDVLPTLDGKTIYVEKGTKLQDYLSTQNINSNWIFSSYVIQLGDKSTEAPGKTAYYFNDTTNECLVTLKYQVKDGTVYKLNKEYIYNYSVQLHVVALNVFDTTDLDTYSAATKTVNQYTTLDDLATFMTNALQTLNSEYVTVTWSAGYYDGETLLDKGTSVVKSTDAISGMFELATATNELFKVTVEIKLDPQSSYIFAGAKDTYEFTISYEINARETFDDANLVALNNSTNTVAKDTTLNSILPTLGLSTNWTLNKWTVEYVDTESVKAEGTNSDDFTFALVKDYEVTLEVKVNDGYCYLDSNTYYETYSVKFTVKVLDTISTTDLSNLALTKQTTYQYDSLENLFGTYISDMKKAAGTDLSIKWSAGYYDQTGPLGTGLNVADKTTEVKGYLTLATLADQYFQISFTFKLTDDSIILFDNGEREFNVTIQYEVTESTTYEDANLRALNNKFYTLPVGTKLSDITNEFALNTNTLMINWTISYTDTTELTNKKEEGAPADDYTFATNTYKVTFNFETAAGTILLDISDYYSKYSVQMTVIILPIEESVIDTKDKTVAAGVVDMGTMQVQKLDNIKDYVDTLFDNTNAIDSVAYKFGTEDYVNLEESLQFTAVGSETYIIKFKVKISDENKFYYLSNKEGDILAQYSDAEDTTNAYLTVSVTFEISDFVVIDLDTVVAPNELSFNDAWANNAIAKGNNPLSYFTYGLDTYADFVSAEIQSVALSTEDLNNANYFDQFVGTSITIKFTVKAKLGYSFDAEGKKQNTFTFTNIYVSDVVSFDTWIGNIEHLDFRLHVFIEFNNALISVSEVELPQSTSTYNVAYALERYDTSNVLVADSATGWVDAKSQSDTIQLAHAEINKLSYKIGYDAYYTDSTIWAKKYFIGCIYIYRMNDASYINAPTPSSLAQYSFVKTGDTLTPLKLNVNMASVYYRNQCSISALETNETYVSVSSSSKIDTSGISFIPNYNVNEEFSSNTVYNYSYVMGMGGKYYNIWLMAY